MVQHLPSLYNLVFFAFLIAYCHVGVIVAEEQEPDEEGGECEVDIDGRSSDGTFFRTTQQDEIAGDSSSGGSGDSPFSWLLPDKNPLEFLKNSVFGQRQQQQQLQQQYHEEPFDGIHEGVHPDPIKNVGAMFDNIWKLLTPDNTAEDDDSNDSHLHDFMINSLKTSSSTHEDQNFFTILKDFGDTFGRVKQQLQRTFGSIGLERLNVFQIWYYMLKEESEKNSVWKRRQHRFLPTLQVEEAISLSDGLFLSQLSYVGTCEQVHDSLLTFHNDTWALINCTTIGLPARPAHFVAVRKHAEELNPNPPLNFPWDKKKKKERVLEVVVVVRGSKEIADFLSDALLEPVPYRDGLAHGGIASSAVWLHDLYSDFFHSLLELSRASRIKIWLCGHSLGGGTAALTSMEFNAEESDQLEAHAVVFGPPAVLSRELSESLQSTVTTVINDADVVPRLSGASIINVWLRIVNYNWTDDALADLELILPVLKKNLPMGETLVTEDVERKLMEWLKNSVRFSVGGVEGLLSSLLSIEPKLFPPGDCVHLYRDGVQFQGAYIDCHRFSELELVINCLDDHLIPPGYYAGLLGFVRAQKNDCNWQFEHDLMAIPVV